MNLLPFPMLLLILISTFLVYVYLKGAIPSTMQGILSIVSEPILNIMAWYAEIGCLKIKKEPASADS